MTGTDDARLADGVVVQARLVARLLGRLRLLTVEGTVVLSPAHVDALTAQSTVLPATNRSRAARAPALSRPVGARLADVARDLDVNLRRLQAAHPTEGSNT